MAAGALPLCRRQRLSLARRAPLASRCRQRVRAMGNGVPPLGNAVERDARSVAKPKPSRACFLARSAAQSPQSRGRSAVEGSEALAGTTHAQASPGSPLCCTGGFMAFARKLLVLGLVVGMATA